jgi:acetylornithine deacetylase/succinyl-diaminopimelate desuccinylase-like protein
LADSNRDALFAWPPTVRAEFESRLREFVEIPSVSADPAHQPDIARLTELACATLREFGATDVRAIRTDGNPVVVGRFAAAGPAPTVTVYNHLDVQPAGEPQWRTDPFRLGIDGERYLGRGTTDDKGPALTALFGARRAQQDGLPLHIRFLWELEEEIGSPNFEQAVREAGESIQTDSVVVSDTVWVARGKPAVPAGLRGLQTMLLRLDTGATDQHSGVTGGAARNPIAEMCAVVAGCVDARTGRCKVPGFYDDALPPTKAELEDFRASGFTVAQFKKDHEFKSLRTNDALEVMKRIWAMPTFEVHGLVGGYAGPGVKTVIPPYAEAKISTRLVPDMKPAKIVQKIRAHVRKLNPDVRVETQHHLMPYRGKTTGPHADAVRRAIRFAFGKTPVFVREGGSIGAVLTMEQRLRAPVTFIGLSLPEHGYHAPNENYDWTQASGGMIAFRKYFEELAALGR